MPCPPLYLETCRLQLKTTITSVYFRLTRQTDHQPFTNVSNTSAPSKRLMPTHEKSYQMFYQKVTHSLPTCNMISIRAPVLEHLCCSLPCTRGRAGVGVAPTQLNIT